MAVTVVLLLLVALTSAAADGGSQAGSALPATPQAWSDAARRNVEAAFAMFLANHAGARNTEDPGFIDRLRASRADALALTGRVSNAAGYAALLGVFTAGLRDGHAAVLDDLGAVPDDRWPGFVPVWRGEHLYVFDSLVREVPKGSEILACDGRAIRTLVRDNVFAFGGRPDEAGQWWSQARNLFRDNGNPFIKRPGHCELKIGERTSGVTLAWRETDPDYTAWRAASYNGDRLPPGLGEPRPGLFWFAMPTFTPDASERAAYRRDFDALVARRAEVLRADAIVVDLRHNQGGSDLWPERLAEILWGRDHVDALPDPAEVWWRLSEGNMRYIESLKVRMAAEGQPETAGWAERIASGMRKAAAGGQDYYVEPPEPSPTPGDDDAASTVPLTTPVYVIVPGQCASACLDALDLFTRFPNTRLIGAPSSADTVYLEIRSERTPDGLAKVVIPIKLYRKRLRAAGQIYRPAIEVDDLAWSTAAFRNAIEADLRTRKR